MKKKIFLKNKTFITFFVGIIMFTLVSCASTPITETPAQEEYKITLKGTGIPGTDAAEEFSQMDFIGYKSNISLLSVAASTNEKESFLLNLAGGSMHDNSEYTSGYEYWRDVRDTEAMEQFVYSLESGGVVTNESELYFGDFTPQDLAVYNSKNRYVTFIDVLESNLSWLDTGNFQKAWTTAGSALIIAGGTGLISSLGNAIDKEFDFSKFSNDELIGLYLSSAGIVAGLLAFTPSAKVPRSVITYRGRFAICVYDTQSKKLVKRKIIDYEQEETFTGSFESDKTEQSIVYEYFGKGLANRLLKEYERLSDQVR